MKILLLGKNGQIGWELQRTLAPLGKIIALGREDLDLVDQNAIRSTVRSVKPALIINAAAYTAVDQAESEPELAMAVNGIAPGILAEEAMLCRAKLIHYSTDYVFDGTKKTPYNEKDIPNPINIYGKTKLAGERAILETGTLHLILRTSWVYGLRGNNFLLTIWKLAQKNDSIKVVYDQIGAPTWCRSIAETTALLLKKDNQNQHWNETYHLSASGETSWADFAEAFFENINSKTKIIPINSYEYKTNAKRPLNSLLCNKKFKKNFNIEILHWHNLLNQVIEKFHTEQK